MFDLDRYVARPSALHRLDPRLKFVATALYIVNVATVPVGSWLGLAASLIIVVVCVAIGRLPVTTLLKRSAVVLPFVGIAALSLPFAQSGAPVISIAFGARTLAISANGLSLFATVLAKGWLAVLMSAILVATTRFPELLQAMQALRVPSIMVVIISFMHRYLFVLVDEAMRMQTARASRSSGTGRSVFWRASVLGSMIGSLFVRSIARSERIYDAMLSRGYAGTVISARSLAWQPMDTVSGGIWALLLAASVVAGHVMPIVR